MLVYWYRMDDSREAHRFLISTAQDQHPLVAELILRNSDRLDDLQDRRTDLFLFLAKTVVGQQLSTAAANSIWSRIVETADHSDLDISLFQHCNFDRLRSCGLSSNKANAIIGLRDAYVDGRISDESVMSKNYEDISECITGLWGFGQWSADMVAIFYAQLPDVWPETDVAVQRGFRQLIPTGQRPTDAARVYSPFRSQLARHIWMGLDSGSIRSIAGSAA